MPGQHYGWPAAEVADPGQPGPGAFLRPPESRPGPRPTAPRAASPPAPTAPPAPAPPPPIETLCETLVGLLVGRAHRGRGRGRHHTPLEGGGGAVGGGGGDRVG